MQKRCANEGFRCVLGHIEIPYKTNGKRMILMVRVQELSQNMDMDVSCRFRYPCRSHNSSEHAPLRSYDRVAQTMVSDVWDHTSKYLINPMGNV